MAIRYKKALKHLLIFAVLAIYMLILQGRCIFRLITSVPCLACGETRAIMSLLKGDIGLAMQYHPLVFAVPLLIMICAHWSILSKKINKTILGTSVVVILLALIIVYAIRLSLNLIP